MRLSILEKMELSDLLLIKRRELLKRNQGKETIKSLRLLKTQQKIVS